eukprot:evm.model.NODE_13296_length_10878_cov_27.487865.1
MTAVSNTEARRESAPTATVSKASSNKHEKPRTSGFRAWEGRDSRSATTRGGTKASPAKREANFIKVSETIPVVWYSFTTRAVPSTWNKRRVKSLTENPTKFTKRLPYETAPRRRRERASASRKRAVSNDCVRPKTNKAPSSSKAASPGEEQGEDNSTSFSPWNCGWGWCNVSWPGGHSSSSSRSGGGRLTGAQRKRLRSTRT